MRSPERPLLPSTKSEKPGHPTDVSLLPALNLALLALGAAIHGHPMLLRPMLHLVHNLAVAL